MTVRRAVIHNCDARHVKPYLPDNYRVVREYQEGARPAVEIEGEDDHGWTLDGYVLPRLASGLYFGEEVLEWPTGTTI